MSVKIIKGTPIPKRMKGAGTWPLDDLKVGDSFKISKEKRPSSMNGLYSVAKNHGMKLSYRTLSDGGVQVWRTE